MKPVPPHHLLSAFLDGELSSEEREVVERLLAESPAARQELQELERVGDLLRQISPETLPRSFATEVLDVCLSDTGPFESETLAELSASSGPALVEPAKPSSNKRPLPWRSIAGLSFSLAAVALVLVLVLPDPAKEHSTEIAANSPQASENDELEPSGTNRSREEGQEIALAPPNGIEAEEFNGVNLPQPADDQVQRAIKEMQIARDQPMDAFASRPPANPVSPTLPGQGDAGQGSPGQRGGFQRTFPQLGEQVAVVKVFVGDRRQGLDHLQEFLQRQNIQRVETASGKPGESAKDDLKDSEMVAVYVETTEVELNNALEKLQKELVVQQVKRETPIAMAELDLKVDPKARKRMLPGFGGGGGVKPQPTAPSPQGFQAARLPKPQPEAKVGNKPVEKSAAKKDREPKAKGPQKLAAKPNPITKPEAAPKPEAASEGQPEPAKKAPAPRIGVASASNALDKLRSPFPEANNLRTLDGNEMGDREADRRRSRQKQLTLPKALLDRLQKKHLEAETTPETPRETSNTPAQPGKRVQVLFILVDQPSKTAPPAGQSNTGDKNGASK